MLLILYSVAFTLALPFVFLHLWVKSRRNADYRRRWTERMGNVPAPESPVIWLHCVSVGEVEAAAPLIDALLQEYADHRLLITCMTPTGSDRIRRKYAARVDHTYLPYDTPWTIGRFLARKRPRLGLIMETEVWPNLLLGCQRRGIPVLLINARLSPRSFARYHHFAKSLAPVFASLRVAARGPEDARYFRQLDVKQVDVMGDIKLDVRRTVSPEQATDLLPAGRPAWIAASTHEGEEPLVLQAQSIASERMEGLLLVLVPRHRERFEEVARLLAEQRVPFVRYSAIDGAGTDAVGNARVLLVDTMGDLVRFYAAGQLAFVGGSLIERGGHNPYEAVVHDCAVLTGPHYFNFTQAYETLLDAGAALQVADAQALADAVVTLLQSKTGRRQMLAAGHQVLQRGQGATHRALALIRAMDSERTGVTPAPS
jgi:3-deoxy-D-manno-octulosonic-acid transferase